MLLFFFKNSFEIFFNKILVELKYIKNILWLYGSYIKNVSLVNIGKLI